MLLFFMPLVIKQDNQGSIRISKSTQKIRNFPKKSLTMFDLRFNQGF